MGSNKIPPASIWGSDEPWVIVHSTSKDKITRFLGSQNIIPCNKTLYEEALEEIKQGKKSGHRIWFIFPQLKGLGRSCNSRYFSLDVDEVNDYVNNKILYDRLIEITEALLENDKPIENIVGSIDALKIKSCMTLFYLKTNNELFKKVLDKFYDGKYCKYTKEVL